MTRILILALIFAMHLFADSNQQMDTTDKDFLLKSIGVEKLLGVDLGGDTLRFSEHIDIPKITTKAGYMEVNAIPGVADKTPHYFTHEMSNEILSSIDSVTEYPINELIGSCCRIRNDKVRLYLENGYWTIGFECRQYRKGYLTIHRNIKGKDDSERVKEKYWIHFNSSMATRLKKFACDAMEKYRDELEADCTGCL